MRKIALPKKAVELLNVKNPGFRYDSDLRRPVVAVYYEGLGEPFLYSLKFVKESILPRLKRGDWAKIEKTIFTTII